jgi:hypothetical protein
VLLAKWLIAGQRGLVVKLKPNAEDAPLARDFLSTLEHCLAATQQPGKGAEEDATRAAAAQMLGSLVALERGLKRSGLH